jgi:CubicO group peptidase (beta-lactamase class C family)
VGCAIEGASHLKFANYMQQMVFTPAGMTATVADDPRKIIAHRAHGYEKSKEGEIENAPYFDPSDRLPGGGWLSTSDDLVRFAAAVMAGRLVPKETLQIVWKASSTRDDGSSYGLGWGISKAGPYQVVGHSGGQAGTSTVLLMIPEKRLAVAAMANVEGVDLDGLAREILASYTGH